VTAKPAVDQALRFLAARPRSETEVRRRLARRRVPAEAIEDALRQLRGAGLVDDAAFATYWVDQRRTFRPRGARLLQAELRAHGVATEIAASHAISDDEDAYRAALKKARRLAALDDATFKTRIGAFLARRGFDWDVIGTTVARVLRERSAER
jgi:regulatory protein